MVAEELFKLGRARSYAPDLAPRCECLT